MEWESDTPCHRHMYPKQGCKSPRRHSNWELKCRDCGAIPGWGLQLTARRWPEGMWGRRLWWEMPVEEKQAVIEAKWYFWVICRRCSHHYSLSLSSHASTGSWTIKRLALQAADMQNNRVGLQSVDPFKGLTGKATEKDPSQGSPLNAWTGRAMEMDKPKRPSRCQLPEARKTLW